MRALGGTTPFGLLETLFPNLALPWLRVLSVNLYPRQVSIRILFFSLRSWGEEVVNK